MSAKKDIRRRKVSRPLKRTTLIATEGLTETEYIERLAQYLRATGTTVVSFQEFSVGKDPKAVLEELKKRMNLAPVGRQYDEGWVVVDVDEHTTLDECLRKAAKEDDISIVVSNPSIEIWLLWHHSDHYKQNNAEQLRTFLRKYGHVDRHLPQNFPIDKYLDAITRSSKCGESVGEGRKGKNPSSALPALVRYLQKP